MRAQRTVALLVGAAAMIAAVAGAALIGPSAASAAPEAAAAYPAQPPSATVNASSVTPGRSVRVAGMGFGTNEPVLVDVVYRIFPGTPALQPPFQTPGSGVSRADGNGDVHARVALTFPGYATITLKGLRSHKTARVTVRVVAWGGNWSAYFRPGTFNGPYGGGALGVGAFGGAFGFGDGFPFGGGSPFGAGPISYRTTTELTLASHQQQAPNTPAGAELIAGMLGLVGLAGSALVTVRAARRVTSAAQ